MAFERKKSFFADEPSINYSRVLILDLAGQLVLAAKGTRIRKCCPIEVDTGFYATNGKLRMWNLQHLTPRGEGS